MVSFLIRINILNEITQAWKEIMLNKSARLGVDIGGTFTDVVLEISGVSYSEKF